MAAMNIAGVSMRLPELSSGKPNTFRYSLTPSKKPVSTVSLTVSASSLDVTAEKPEIELEFIGPKADDPVEKAKAVSGDKLLRSIMLDNKIELYAPYGKVMNCGGGGSCGTCIVEILDGEALLNERTNTELRYLKKKPESWRLACQTIVGNKENAGKVVVQRLPQWKK
ncbi:Na(+)-translocating NADH-quinone reductase subunit F [Euphorbia peplus]|nr:Na(+)-translocating NADH-quinone reductase subunit F [Euphorbia peplus]